MEKQTRIDELVKLLNRASDAYYGGQEERMTNYEWDARFDELAALERETQYVRADSPTQTTGHAEEEQDAAGEKEPHEYPALSLAKTKEIAALQEWAGERPVWLSWKLDGLTLVLTYDGGRLSKILTRGNGTVGTNITYMREVLGGFPQAVADTGHLVVRGEATISYTDFEAINDTLDDGDDKYANPRNLASGTLALDKTNLAKVKERHVCFHAFTLVHTDRELLSWGGRMEYLDFLGFTTVAREKTQASALPDAVARWTAQVESGEMDLPVDGLVLTYDDTAFAATGSVTGHHATRAGFAYKWQDVAATTTLDHIEWSCAASIITPVAIFEPVQLEGTTVSRASLCNISELKRLGIGENKKTTLQVIKANKIIPKCIAVPSALGTFTVPDCCPVCGAPTEIRVSEKSKTETLRCTNPACPAKHLKRFARFVSKAGMDIDGLSVQTITAFVNKGLIHEFGDVYRLNNHAEEIVAMEGMGAKSCANLLAAIEKSRDVKFSNFLFALCIPLIGLDAGKKIAAAIGTDGFFERIAVGQTFEDVDGIGSERSSSLAGWFADAHNKAVYDDLMANIRVEKAEPQDPGVGVCAGLTFVITGDVHHFKNRNAFKAYVESEGGAVTGSVSKKTNYLVNNDATSTSAKNTKARALQIPILTEEAFLQQFGGPKTEAL